MGVDARSQNEIDLLVCGVCVQLALKPAFGVGNITYVHDYVLPQRICVLRGPLLQVIPTPAALAICYVVVIKYITGTIL
ncbi:hypothetical protein F5883DRAFT_63804 [Diaporthe sp. PMI_573]|nr:hypothetical protein F5883DRAFT_63804 [Diaporthaceae sp. PMI_573]